MTAAHGPAVVLGVGNVLRRDDGAGIRVIEELRRLVLGDPTALPAGTRLVDGGTLGLGLLDVVHGAGSLLVVDAVSLGKEPGTVSILRDDTIATTQEAGPAATTGAVGELLAVARLMGWLPDAVTLVGLQVGEVGLGTTLSPRVATAVSNAVEAVRSELRSLDERAAAGPPAIPAARNPEEAAA